MTVNNRFTAGVKFASAAAIVHIFRGPEGFFKPVLGPLMQRRRVIALLAIAVIAMMALTAARVSTWQCPLRSTLGIICPGCGLTRAMVLFIQGRWQASIALHAFAPLVVASGILLVAGSAVPAGLQQKMVARIADFERRTGIAALLVLSALIYWLIRIFHLI